jgi:hypothetical protein
MKSITVKYGVDTLPKQVPGEFTCGDLQESDSCKAGLAYGDSIKLLIDGIEQNGKASFRRARIVRLA